MSKVIQRLFSDLKEACSVIASASEFTQKGRKECSLLHEDAAAVKSQDKLFSAVFKYRCSVFQ